MSLGLFVRKLLIAIWLTFALICVGLALLVLDVYDDSEQMRISRGLSDLNAACQAINAAYVGGVESSALTDTHVDTRNIELDRRVIGALKTYSGVEGGIWSKTQGFVAYGYPSYGGSVPKTDIPSAETSMISGVASIVSLTNPIATSQRIDDRETVLVSSCRLAAPPEGVAAWTLTRVHRNGPGFARLNVAIWMLLSFALVAGTALTWIFRQRTQRFQTLESALATFDVTSPQPIASSNDRELDRVVKAINAMSLRLDAAHAEAAMLSDQVIRSERHAALGRMSAIVAHEIRNPLAAVRLKVENAQSDGTMTAYRTAAEFVLAQLTRLEILVRHLLSTTQPVALNKQKQLVSDWVRDHIQLHVANTRERQVLLKAEGDDFEADFDAFQLGRALDNILDNAIRFAPSGTSVLLTTRSTEACWTIRVCDNGAGIAPEIRSKLFEPFVTGRTDGNGLGLSVALDIVKAHGGTLRALEMEVGACFEMELPWHAS